MIVETGNGWTMHLGDCLEVLPTLDRVDHVITDPPYEVEAHTKARRSLKDSTQRRGARNKGEVRRIDEALEISFPAITEAERCGAAAHFGHLTSRWTLVFCQIEGVSAWRSALVAGGLEWVRGGVWRKPNGAPQFTGDRPGQGFECIAIAHHAGRKRWNGGGRHAVWECPLDHGAGNGRRQEHPTTKPLALMLSLVEDFTDRDDLVLDPFAGSGTTGIAARRLDRRFIGIERDARFFRLACERLRAEEHGNTLEAARAGQVAMFAR